MGAAGQGSISKANKNTPSGAPFPAGSAYNGVSVDPVTGQIVLGDDPGSFLSQLISNRELPLNGFSLVMSDLLSGVLFEIGGSPGTPTMLSSRDNVGSTSVLTLFGDSAGSVGFNIQADDAAGTSAWLLADATSERIRALINVSNFLDLDKSLDQYSIGDISGSFQGTKLLIDDSIQRTTIEDAAGQMLFLDQLNKVYQIGDISGIGGTGLKLMIDDLFEDVIIRNTAAIFMLIDPDNELYTFGAGGTGNAFQIRVEDFQERIMMSGSGGERFEIDVANGQYQFGDTQGVENGLALLMDDTNERTVIDDNLGEMLVLDRGIGAYSFGDIDGDLNGTRFVINDTGQTVLIKDTAGDMLSIDRINGFYGLGDIDSVTNGSRVVVDDTAETISLRADNGVLTTDPGAGAGAWKLGQVTAGAVALDAANYVEVMIDGSIVKLLKAV